MSPFTIIELDLRPRLRPNAGMTGRDHDLDGAYALQTPDDSRQYYRDWAKDYDQDFAAAMAYRLPALIADAFAERGGTGPVLDVGAGTGLVADALARHGIGPVDAIDISPEMLAVAGAKGLYRNLFEADLTQSLALPDATYSGVTSSGTFTHGHVGPEAFDELLRIARPGALFCFSINAGVFSGRGFDRRLAELSPKLAGVTLDEVAIYGPAADPAHRDDRALVLRFHKA